MIERDEGIRGVSADCAPADEMARQWSGRLAIVGATELPVLPAKKTIDCFQGALYRYRDYKIDQCLPAEQQASSCCLVSTLASPVSSTVAARAGRALGLAVGTPLTEIEEQLKRRGHVLTLPQMEALVDVIEERIPAEAVIARISCYGFVLNEAQDISVMRLVREERWYASVSLSMSAILDECRSHLFIKNLRTPQLQPFGAH